MQKTHKRIILFSSIVIFLFLITVLLLKRIQEPPAIYFVQAREAISAAKKSNAELYAKTEFELAEQCYDSAMAHWKRQNDRFILNRDYTYSNVFIKHSRLHADKAFTDASKIKLNLKEKLHFQINDLKEQVSKYQHIFNSLPIPGDLVSKNSQGHFLLLEAESTYTRGRYKDIERNLNIAEENLEKSYQFANNLLSEYFLKYPIWVKQAEETRINSKKNGTYAIIVDKFARECYVYFKGNLIQTFEIELGKNWLGNKNFQGDQATPEGVYYIVKKKLHNKTKYHKALLLNYPNEEDKKRFHFGKNNGTLQSSTRIGNLIELHGEGGKGIDWTQGCVAFQNKDIDKLYQWVDENTPVTIVGSLKPLDKILEEYEHQKK